ncbi:MAG: ABC transporter substrate-binding protein [Erysipelotrichaceae bacterium]|nr:ABC transporter substrate-binding protein [Erysipelotrichaceae bacterium]
MKFNSVMKSGLAALMSLSLVACGGSSASTSTGGSATGTAAFKLGGTGPTTGDAAIYGQAVENGAKLAVEAVNAAGKVALEFNFQDDQADGEKASTAYNTLIDWGMQVSIGATTSGAGQALSPLFVQDDIFAITPSGSSTAVIYQNTETNTDPYGNVFQMCFTDPNQGVASADYISANKDLGTKVAIIYRNDDNYSSGVTDKFKEEAEKVNLDVVYTGGFANGTTDFSVYVTAAKDAGADVVFLPIYYQPASQILAEANKQGYTPTFFGCDGMDGILTMEGFDTTLAEGLYMLTPFAADATDDATVDFVTKYKDAYGETPNQFAADAYDAVMAIAQALEKAGVSATDAQADITAALKTQFTSMTFDGLTGTNVTWNENGEVSKAPKAIVIQGGAYVSAE